MPHYFLNDRANIIVQIVAAIIFLHGYNHIASRFLNISFRFSLLWFKYIRKRKKNQHEEVDG